jgi:hypothetical protein
MKYRQFHRYYKEVAGSHIEVDHDRDYLSWRDEEEQPGGRWRQRHAQLFWRRENRRVTGLFFENTGRCRNIADAEVSRSTLEGWDAVLEWEAFTGLKFLDIDHLIPA